MDSMVFFKIRMASDRSGLSIPLNGFLGQIVSDGDPVLWDPTFNSIEWIQNNNILALSKRLNDRLSIPLNGFLRASFTMSWIIVRSSFNSIEWILL